jgi:hypothetical protein
LAIGVSFASLTIPEMLKEPGVSEEATKLTPLTLGLEAVNCTVMLGGCKA